MLVVKQQIMVSNYRFVDHTYVYDMSHIHESNHPQQTAPSILRLWPPIWIPNHSIYVLLPCWIHVTQISCSFVLSQPQRYFLLRAGLTYWITIDMKLPYYVSFISFKMFCVDMASCRVPQDVKKYTKKCEVVCSKCKAVVVTWLAHKNTRKKKQKHHLTKISTRKQSIHVAVNIAENPCKADHVMFSVCF